MFRSLAILLLALCMAGACAAPARAQGMQVPLATGEAEAWLVTYGPGEVYWQRFGHNAIWIRDPLRNIDHTFNFGFFDFHQERFMQRFVQGRMLYFSAAQSSTNEFLQYWMEDRSIRAQKLELDAFAFDRLLNHLVAQVQPDQREYRYDYYLDNCSTRVRDALDIALQGALGDATRDRPAAQNFRQHTRRSVTGDPGYYLALELGLGWPTDRDISRWDEMFLPEIVAQEAASLEVDGTPLVSREIEIVAAVLTPPPGQPPSTWGRYGLLSAGLVVLFALLARLAGPVMLLAGINAWLMIAASAGALLAYLWLGTDHQVAGPNANLLLLNPLLVLGLWASLRRLAAVLLAAGLVGMLAVALMPRGQYLLDVLALAGPISAISAWLLWTRDFSHIRGSLRNPLGRTRKPAG